MRTETSADEDLHAETSPLEAEALLPKSDHDDLDKPLPKGQLALLVFARFVEPVAFFSIWPYVNAMVHETGVPDSQTGFYVGLVESLFSLTQFLVMPFWGRLSDQRGRKGILVTSMFGLTITTALFGLSTQVWQMILFRCLSGLFSGSTVTIRTMISEISTHKTQATAFSWFAFAGNAAVFIAPLSGGYLSHPAENYAIFRNFEILVAYPYLLPCLATSTLALSVAVTLSISLKETLKRKFDGTGSKTALEQLSTKELLQSEGVGRVLLISVWTSAIGLSYTALSPVTCFTPINLGGFGLSPQQISSFMAIFGCMQTIWVLVIFPRLHKRIGNRGILHFVAIGWPLLCTAYPLINLASRRGMGIIGFWVVAAVVAAVGASVGMSQTACQLILNDIAPFPSALGALNGLSLSCSAAVRALAPAVMSSLYAVGVDNRILGGQLAWIILIVLGVVYNGIVRQLPRKAWGQIEQH